MMKLAALATTPLLLLPLLTAPAHAAAPAAARYGSCDALLAHYPSGVARDASAASAAVRAGFERPAASKKARAVYRANHRSLDRDKDGTACEQTA